MSFTDQLPPLADLHCHLDGSMRLETLEKLARDKGVDLPDDFCFYQAMGLQEALSRFALTLSLLQETETVRTVAAEICEDAAADGVTTLEIRFAPQLHQAAPIEDIVDAALEGIDGRAGVILCTLYGEPPSVAHTLVEIASNRPGVVGIDLAGGPASGHEWRMEDYSEAFSRARDLGIGRTVHAGEGRPPREIRTAIEVLHAQRIGHGTTLLQDFTVLDLVLSRQITIEACPTSNLHTGVIASLEDHPIAAWLELDVRVCVCPDNTLLSAVTASEEHRRVGAIPEIDEEQLRQIIANGHAAAFRR